MAVTVALIAAAVSAIGWLVTHVLSTRAEAKKQRLASHLAHVEKQLAELYGPLAFLVLEGRSSFNDLATYLGRRSVFQDDEPISPDDLATWLYWVDNSFMPRHEKIQALLSTRTHLIVGATMPASYLAYMDHYNTWRVVHQRWKDEQVPYSWHSKTSYPSEFVTEVLATFFDLKKEHARLVGLTR